MTKANKQGKQQKKGQQALTVKSGPSRFTGGVPDRAYTKLRYVAVGSLTTPSSVGSFNCNVWSSNLHDPDYSGVGHQPLYYDQYTALYKYYRVHGFRYKLEVTNGGSWGANLYISQKPDSALITASIETEMERPTCVSRRILPSASGMNHHNFGGYVDIAKVWGISKAEFIANDSFFAEFGAGPASTASVQFGYGMSGASTTTLDISLYLEFDVEMWKRKDIAGS